MRIALDLGHGVGQDRGADGRSFGGCLEEEIINAIGGNLVVHLRNLGHEVIEVRPSCTVGVNESLNYRTDTANQYGCDLYISLHANAGQGTGTEVFTYNGEATEKATNVLNQICSLGFRNRGIKSEELAVINNTNMEAMLIEICFCDNPSDVALFKSCYDNIARTIAGGVSNCDVIIRQPIAPVQPTTQQTEFNSGGFRVVVGSFNDKANADKRIQELKSMGIDAFVIFR